jgi:hypothetical protein
MKLSHNEEEKETRIISFVEELFHGRKQIVMNRLRSMTLFLLAIAIATGCLVYSPWEQSSTSKSGNDTIYLSTGFSFVAAYSVAVSGQFDGQGAVLSSVMSTTNSQQTQQNHSDISSSTNDNKPTLLRSRKYHEGSSSSSTYKLYRISYNQTSRQRRMPGGYAEKVGDPSNMAVILIVIVGLVMLCCCRGMLCDLLACVCLYRICCDDAAIGGFEMM